MAPLDPSLFPGVPNVGVHEGFRNAHQATASQILQEVENLISSKGSTQVIAVSIRTLIKTESFEFTDYSHDLCQVGHSLGGALAELDSLFLKLNLDSSISVKAVTYGTPRVGNLNYAAFFDQTVRFPPFYPLGT
jgi:predicted lipase